MSITENPNIHDLVEDYLMQKCDKSMQHAVRNLLKVVFHSAQSSVKVTQLELALSGAISGNSQQQQQSNNIMSNNFLQHSTNDKQFYEIPELQQNELKNDIPEVVFTAVQEKSSNNCYAINSSYYEDLLKNERPIECPENFAYKIVGSIDQDDYVLESTFYEELCQLIEIKDGGSSVLVSQLNNSNSNNKFAHNEIIKQRSDMLKHSKPMIEEGEEQIEIDEQQNGSFSEKWRQLNETGPEVDIQENQELLSQPAKPNLILTPMKKQSRENENSSDSFIQDTNTDLTRSQLMQQKIMQIIQAMDLNKQLIIKMNNRFDFPMRCEYVRKICSECVVPDVLQFLNSSFDIPVHYEVYNDYQGLMEFFEVQSQLTILASRYIITDSQFNNDGVFGEVLCGFDIQTKQYVALKRQKTPDAFSQLVNEIRTLLYINSHDRQYNYTHFSKMNDFFIQHGCLFIVFEFLGENLYRLAMKYQNERAHTFSIKQLKQISKKVLESVHFLEKLGLQHFDIKPENIVLLRGQKKNNDNPLNSLASPQENSILMSGDLKDQFKEYEDIAQILKVLPQKLNNIDLLPNSDINYDDEIEVKLIDIGSHHFFSGKGNPDVPYVQSRFYRAPEVILQIPYDSRTETFSYGSVLFELATSDPLFVTDVSNKFYQQQLANFVGLLGPIPTDMIVLGQMSHKYFTRQFKLYATGQTIVDNFDDRFVVQDQEELEQILNENEADYFYIQPLRYNFNRFFREKLEKLDYFNTEKKEDVLELIRFTRKCLEIDLKKRPFIDQLLQEDGFVSDHNLQNDSLDEVKEQHINTHNVENCKTKVSDIFEEMFQQSIEKHSLQILSIDENETNFIIQQGDKVKHTFKIQENQQIDEILNNIAQIFKQLDLQAVNQYLEAFQESRQMFIVGQVFELD